LIGGLSLLGAEALEGRLDLRDRRGKRSLSLINKGFDLRPTDPSGARNARNATGFNPCAQNVELLAPAAVDDRLGRI
jgi:hypothetical protein